VADLEPFRIDVPDDILADLAERLRRTRFPNEIPGISWDQGVALGYLQEIVRYWRVHEARLNRYEQLTTTVESATEPLSVYRLPSADSVPAGPSRTWTWRALT
jgi:epoxide hydrolase